MGAVWANKIMVIQGGCRPSVAAPFLTSTLQQHRVIEHIDSLGDDKENSSDKMEESSFNVEQLGDLMEKHVEVIVERKINAGMKRLESRMDKLMSIVEGRLNPKEGA